MSEYVPTTEEVRARMVESIAGGTISVPGGYGDLARDDAENIVDAILGELAAHDAEVAAKAWDEGAERATEFERGWLHAVRNGETVPQRPQNPYRKAVQS